MANQEFDPVQHAFKGLSDAAEVVGSATGKATDSLQPVVHEIWRREVVHRFLKAGTK